jgi:hypothetical protein
MRKLLTLGLVVAVAWAVTPAMAGDTVWYSARGANAVPPHRIHEFDADGVYTGTSIDEVADAQTSAWGYRDGASDETSLFFGWETGLAQHNADGTGGVEICPAGAPTVGTWRALAFDPTGDGGSGSFWVGDFADGIVEVARDNCAQLTLLPNSTTNPWSVYGLAYNAATDSLWAHHTGCQVWNIPTIPNAPTSVLWNYSAGGDCTAQGGLSLKSDSNQLYGVSQGVPDTGYRTDTAGVVTGGPWDIEGQVGSNGVLGVAATPEPASLALLALGGLAALRRRR